MLTTSNQGYAVVRSFEGRALKAYKDCVGVWTIGYGQTNFDAEILGFKIGPGVTITAEQCEALLKTSMTRRYEPAIRKAMGPDCTQQAFDAGASFHYNCGAIARASWVKSYVAKNMPAVHSGIMAWNKGGGKVLAGLTRRRGREWGMISAGDYGPEGRQVPRDLHTGKAVDVAPVGAPETLPPEQQAGHGGYPGMMRLGDEGPEVKDEQEQLVLLKYTNVTPTGKYDAATEAAVRDFQKNHPQLHEDGILGPATKVSIRRAADAVVKLKKTTAGGTGSTGTVVAIDQATGSHAHWGLYVGVGVIAAIALAYVAWTYRDEIRAMLKAWASR